MVIHRLTTTATTTTTTTTSCSNPFIRVANIPLHASKLDIIHFVEDNLNRRVRVVDCIVLKPPRNQEGYQNAKVELENDQQVQLAVQLHLCKWNGKTIKVAEWSGWQRPAGPPDSHHYVPNKTTYNSKSTRTRTRTHHLPITLLM